MINWTEIIIAIAGAGGLTGIFLITERKTKAALENMQKTIEEWKSFCEEERAEIKNLRERVNVKQQQIDSLYAEREEFMKEREKITTELAVAKLLKCNWVGCDKRKPPLADNIKTLDDIEKGDE